MASKSMAVFLIFLLCGHEVIAMRQRVKQRASAESASGLADMVQLAKTNVHADSQASCDKDIIVETSDGNKKVVTAQDYEKSPFKVLTKHGNDESSATYHLVCADGKAIVRKTSSTNKVSERPFSFFHWWRDTEIKKDEKSIDFTEYFGWSSMSSGKVTFTPSGASCEEDEKDAEKYGSEIVSMLKEHRVRNFYKVSENLRGFANKKKEMNAMGCPSDLSAMDASIADAMEEYFTHNQGGHDSPMADARFTAALEKIRSTSSPTKADFAEVVALMKYGSCPEAEESRASDRVSETLPDEVDESQEEDLEASVQACFAEEDCSALESKIPANEAMSSLLQEEHLAVAKSKGVVGFLVNFLVFLAIFILILVFWPIALFLILVWLMALLIMLPFSLLAGPTVIYDRVTYHIGKYDYLVDEYCRPFVHKSGFPLRKMSDGRNLPAQLAPPIKSYVVFRGGAVFDDVTGWPIAMLDNGVVKPLVGLPRPASADLED